MTDELSTLKAPLPTSNVRKLEEWHPLLPNPTREEVEAMIARPGGAKAYAEFVNLRRRRIRLADEVDGEPFYHGFQPSHWARADAEMRLATVGLYNAGGKRATKSERAGRRSMKAAVKLERGKLWIFQGGERTGIAMQQQLCWKYLPNWIKALNSQRRASLPGGQHAKVNYSPEGGFTEGVLVLPNRTEVYFLTYKMDPKGYQGWEIGFPMTERNLQALAEDPELENIGAWLDEDAPLNWVETCEVRCTTRRAKILWTFSTLNGITPAVKEVLQAPLTVESRRAEVLPADRILLEGCPPGEMPFVQVCGRRGWRAIYFHSDLNPFGHNYAAMKELYAERPEEEIKEHLYGWSKDTKGRVWPNFGEINVIDDAALPKERTNYTLTDPAGKRNWATMWVGVNPSGDHYIYRDWPDDRRFGEWAVPGDAKPGGQANPDGDAGPAQRSLGYGFAKYKRLVLLDQEALRLTPAARERLEELRNGPAGTPALPAETDDALEYLKSVLKDPYRAWIVWKAWQEEESLEDFHEKIHERYMDPRAGRNEQVAEKGGTCVIDEMAKPSVDGAITAPAMRFFPASGVHIDEGIKAVDNLLDYDKTKPAMPVMNYPRLFVARSCKQVIWTMLNYTALGGEMGGCKDFADLLRYMALARLRYVGDGKLKTMGGGSY